MPSDAIHETLRCLRNKDYDDLVQRTFWRPYSDFVFLKPYLNQINTVLDIGAVPPTLAVLLSIYGVQKLHILDPKADDFKEYAAHSGVSLITTDIFDYSPEKIGLKVDLVCFCEVLEHLTGDIRAVVSKLYRSVRPKGLLYVTTPNLQSVTGFYSLMRGSGLASKYNEGILKQFERAQSVDGFFGHIREYTSLEVESIFLSYGFSLEKESFVTRPMRKSKSVSESLVILLEKLFPKHRLFAKYLFRRCE